MTLQQTAPWENCHLERGVKFLRTFGLGRWGLGGSGHVEDSPIARKPITNNLVEQETTLSPPETSFTGLESLSLDKRSPETLHLSVPSDTEVLMEIDKSSTKRPATGNVQEAAEILKPSILIESGGIQTTKDEDAVLNW
ncbi:hypothetical protein TNCT_357351 [Trichonephila clavata]|uniref:Uncharacterized protein n=1 Tax=Trichonephila clavata TaxID=2740835 RepID=A0A8X6J8Q3_TRICU|nr:hypothetical protein TNCT_244471 [Trichonephila clavata]GFR05926.1 hypothetical protein TNCT_357351 [Trichonephila clavata]